MASIQDIQALEGQNLKWSKNKVNRALVAKNLTS